MKGTVKNIPEGKQFGFIRADGLEYFFHRQDFIGDWNELLTGIRRSNIEVEFDPKQSQKGPRAENVRRVE